MATKQYRGLTFDVQHDYDQSAGLPWDNSDMHGPVSDWTREEPGPGDRVLVEEGYHRRLYRFDEAMEIAKRDGWRAGDASLTDEERTFLAVVQDYEFLRDFCEDRWSYICISVTLQGTKLSRHIGSVESNSGEAYLAELERELMEEVIADAPGYIQGERAKFDAIDRAIMAIGVL
jgi:hypothetical protein